MSTNSSSYSDVFAYSTVQTYMHTVWVDGLTWTTHSVHKSSRPHHRAFCPAHDVDIVDNAKTDCPHCPQTAVYTVMYMHTVVCCWGVLVAVGSPHDPQNFEGEGVGPSGWANGSVAFSNNFYFFDIRSQHASTRPYNYEFPFTATCHQRSTRHRGGA